MTGGLAITGGKDRRRYHTTGQEARTTGNNFKKAGVNANN